MTKSFSFPNLTWSSPTTFHTFHGQGFAQSPAFDLPVLGIFPLGHKAWGIVHIETGLELTTILPGALSFREAKAFTAFLLEVTQPGVWNFTEDSLTPDLESKIKFTILTALKFWSGSIRPKPSARPSVKILNV